MARQGKALHNHTIQRRLLHTKTGQTDGRCRVANCPCHFSATFFRRPPPHGYKRQEFPVPVHLLTAHNSISLSTSPSGSTPLIFTMMLSLWLDWAPLTEEERILDEEGALIAKERSGITRTRKRMSPWSLRSGITETYGLECTTGHLLPA